MASIINALSSGTGGIVTAGDASGILQLQTANTAAVTIDGSQNVGIGTTSPANKLHVSDTTTSTVKTRTQASTGYVDVGMGGNSGVFDTTATDGIRLRMSGNDKVAIDGSTLALSGLQGIKFQATQSASSDANTLDDYEEGTFTPKAGNGSTAMATIYKATYTKIGNRVLIDLDVVFPNPNPSDSSYLTNLPFAGSTAAGNGGVGMGYYNGPTSTGLYAHVSSSTTNLAFYTYSGTTVNMSAARIICSLEYQTA